MPYLQNIPKIELKPQIVVSLVFLVLQTVNVNIYTETCICCSVACAAS